MASSSCESENIEYGVKFEHPATIVICGPTSCGKTVLTRELIKQKMFDVEFDEIIWCYTEEGSVRDKLPNVKYVKGFPSDDVIGDDYDSLKLIVLDDMMHDLDKNMAVMFTKKSHHRNMSVIMISQNLYPNH